MTMSNISDNALMIQSLLLSCVLVLASLVYNTADLQPKLLRGHKHTLSIHMIVNLLLVMTLDDF